MVHSNLDRPLKWIPARFYMTPGGREPVREWRWEQEAADRKIIGEDNKQVEFAWSVGMPLVRNLGEGLWEVRANLTGGKIERVIFCVTKEQMFLLHGFIKKTRKTQEAKHRIVV